MPQPRGTRHPAALAPGPGQPPLDASPPPTRSTVDRARAAAPDRTDGSSEPDLGVSAHPRRTRAAWLPDRAERCVAAAQTCRHGPSATTRRADLAAVPIRASQKHARVRLLPCRYRAAQAPVRAV